MGFNYYKDLPHFVSNSTLGDFAAMLNGNPDKPTYLQDIYDFGNLVDAMVTERNKLDFNRRCLFEESSGQEVVFTPYDWRRADGMAIAALADPVLRLIIKDATYQYIVARSGFEYEYDHNIVTMPTRCKFDILNKKHKLACDIKTTACETQKAFVESISHFRYYRQAAIYMDLAKIDKMWYFGIGKKKDKSGKYPVFKFVIERGDDTYEHGRLAYNHLGFLYRHMIYDLQIKTIPLIAA